MDSFRQFLMTSPAPLQSLAPSLWLIIGFPLLGALICGVFGKWLGRANTGLIACCAVGASLLLSILAYWAVNDPTTVTGSQHAFENFRYAFGHDYGTWFQVGSFQVRFGLWVDHLNGPMLLVITGVGLLIHIYSTSYMSHDAGYWRYFAYLNLFVAMMLVLVLADNLVLLFVGWEGVGFCSYLLIGFWYTDPAKAWAGRKAFITNRIGDFAFLIAAFLLVLLSDAYSRQATEANAPGGRIDRHRLGVVVTTGPLNFKAIDSMARGLGTTQGNGPKMSLDTVIQEGPLKGRAVQGVVTAILLLFLLGAAGKSAQLPLYVWLPDAMAGPTPVSALIHAATMVTAGVYLFCRMASLLVLSPPAMATVAIIGALTALIAALIAFAQDDIKKVLAYSTVSQLGFMFMGVGMGVFWAAMFHLVTHAFFKACLFLGAGSVMHGNAEETDIKKLGGVRKEMPWTWLTFAIATVAITGVLPLSGFFSKDAILHGVHGTHLHGLEWVTNFVWIIGLVTAFCTAFYMWRLYILTFEGKRSAEAKIPHAHESSAAMVVPLVVLATLSVFALIWGLHLMTSPSTGKSQAIFENFLAPIFANTDRIIQGTGNLVRHDSPLMTAYVVAILIAWAGAALAAVLYFRFFPAWRAAGKPAPAFASMARGFAVAKFKVDELYELVIINPIKWSAKLLYRVVDSLLIDTLVVRGVAWVTYQTGAALRYFQTGDAQGYAAVMVVALLAGVAYAVWGLGR